MLSDTIYLPADDFQHPVGEDPEWSESYYFFWSDAKSEIAGFSRIGVKGNKGYIEGLNGVYLGGTRVAFSHARIPIKPDHTELSAGGLTYERIEPMKRWKIVLDAEVQDIPDGKILEMPSKERPPGWCTTPRLHMSIDFDLETPPQAFNIDGGQLHFEHFGRVSGTVRIAGIDAIINGYGIRDKSWGPRTWKLKANDFPCAPGVPRTSYKWLAAPFGRDLSFGLSAGADDQGVHRGGGLLVRDGQNKLISDVVVVTEYIPGTLMHKSIHLIGKVEGEKFECHGDVINHCPTKILRADGTATFVTEGLTRWRTPDGRETLGMAEYHTKPFPREKKA